MRTVIAHELVRSVKLEHRCGIFYFNCWTK